MKSRHKPSTPKVEHLSTQEFTFGRATPQNQPTPKATASTKSYAESNPEFYSVDLPSNFHGYPFTSLALSPLKGLHIAKLNRAQKENSLRYLVEAIGATLEPTVSAFDLKPGDFYYLMYWQRVNSYPKSPMLVEVECTNPQHQLEVIEGIRDADGKLKLDESGEVVKKHEDTLTIKEFLNSTTLDVKNLSLPDMSRFDDLASRYALGYETMRDVVDVSEKVIASDDGAPDFAFTAALASFLAPTPEAKTLQARCAIVDKMSVDDINTLQEYIDTVTNFGVSETANLRCKDCGASTRVRISFDALTFLPNSK